MSEEVLGRASDPFFTTKEPGRGIGLGLFLTRNVISQLGGQLEFRSSPGQGTEAIVSIPLEQLRSIGRAARRSIASGWISRENDIALIGVTETEIFDSVKWDHAERFALPSLIGDR